MKTTLSIHHDYYPENPFTDDCNPPLIVLYDRGILEYTQNESVVSSLVSIIESSWIILSDSNTRPAIYVANENDYDTSTYSSYHEYLMDEIRDSNSYDSVLDMYETLATLAGVPFHRFESRWYSQGDYSEWIFILTPEYVNLTGVNVDNAEEIFKETKKLYDAWAWWDVYQFTLTEHHPLYREDGTLSEQTEEKIIDSCGCIFWYDSLEEDLKWLIPQEYHHLIKDAIDNIK